MNRVWTFIISKALSTNELNLITEAGTKFVNGWTAHEQKLTASFEIFKNRIIVVKINEEVTGASGCSIDKLTHFIKQLETEFHIELLNRLLVAYKTENEISVVHSSKIKELLQTGDIIENTIVYNTAVSNQNEFQNWEQLLKNSWLSKYLISV
ncbi:MAG: ABC transporter ATPase [Bacteroidota bacterium]|nr:ABC transporter ATPase [Bacteroidota bacterium]